MWECFAAGQIYESEIAQYLITTLKRGYTFLDIGAHIGYFSLLAAILVGDTGQVMAFEPEGSNFEHLQRHVLLNGCCNVKTFQLALGKRDSTADFYINHDNDGGHALWDVGSHDFNVKSRRNPTVCQIDLRKLDTVLVSQTAGSIKVIKIDAEGCEHDILSGAKGTLLKHALPDVVCEVNGFALNQMNTDEATLRRFMEDLGYNAYLLRQAVPQLVKLAPDDRVRSDGVFTFLFSKVDDAQKIVTSV
jgi:FkbM family methyltransferase